MWYIKRDMSLLKQLSKLFFFSYDICTSDEFQYLITQSQQAGRYFFIPDTYNMHPIASVLNSQDEVVFWH